MQEVSLFKVEMYHGCMDVFSFTYAVELARLSLVQTRLNKIDDAQSHRFILWFAVNTKKQALLVSVSPDNSGIAIISHESSVKYLEDQLSKCYHNNLLNESSESILSDRSSKKPQFDQLESTDSNFVKALRFHLKGAYLIHLAHSEGERCIELTFETKTEFGKRDGRVLIIEIMGRHSGAYLLNEKRTVLSIARKYNPSSNRYRRIVTGKLYPSPPPLSKPTAWNIEPDLLIRELEKSVTDQVFKTKRENISITKGLISALTGLDDMIILPLLEKVGLDADMSVLDMISDSGAAKKISEEFQALKKHRNLMGIFDVKSNDVFERFLIDRLFPEITRIEKDKIYISKPKLENTKLGLPKNKTQIRSIAIEREIERLKASVEMEKIADWILIAKSDEKMTRQELVERALSMASDLGCSNTVAPIIGKSRDIEIIAGQIMKTAARYKRALERIVQAVDRDKLYFDSDSHNTCSQSDLDHHQEEFRANESQKHTKEIISLKNLGIRHRVYYSGDGVPIIVGLDAKSNDALLKRFGGTSNWWFHSRDVPGSWVIALTGKSLLSDVTRIDAAIIAAAHSKDNKESNVDVSYTQMKYLRKPKHAKPGLVLMQNEKTVTVNPVDFLRIKEKPLMKGL